ncbi:RnfABCDGE type electron transport complex subunit G [bacterium]|nr:RnfABCDGE type electron transport complex subunit G [bacterium]
MKDIVRPGLILMAYGLIAGLALGLVNSMTAPKIAAQEEAARMAAIEEVLPDAKLFDPDTAGNIEYLTGYADSAESEPVGYVITALGNGFSSTIRTVVGIESDFSIEAIEIVYQSETPGLGTRCVEVKEKGEEPWFEKQFDGKKIAQLAVDKDGGSIKAITGATITSRAVTQSVEKAVEKLKEAIAADRRPEPIDEGGEQQ